jgi:transposase
MSMQPKPWPEVPERTARTARASSRKGNLAMRIRDELGAVYADERFAAAFAVRGKPGISPAQLMIVTVLQFTENLTDRQAAEAVRDRITWKYAIGVELEDPGFDPTVLSEFRDRLVREDLTRVALDALLERLAEQGLVKAGSRARTDSTHVLGAIRSLNRLEPGRGNPACDAGSPGGGASGVAEPGDRPSMAAGVRSPDRQPAPAHEQDQTGRTDGSVRAGRIPPARPDLRPDRTGLAASNPPAEVLRRIWIQQFYRDVDTATGRRSATAGSRLDGELGPRPAIYRSSPHDLDARYSIKRDTRWGGYKVHFTETRTLPSPSPAGPRRGVRSRT